MGSVVGVTGWGGVGGDPLGSVVGISGWRIVLHLFTLGVVTAIVGESCWRSVFHLRGWSWTVKPAPLTVCSVVFKVVTTRAHVLGFKRVNHWHWSRCFSVIRVGAIGHFGAVGVGRVRVGVRQGLGATAPCL